MGTAHLTPSVGAGYHLNRQLKLSGQITKLFDPKEHDIDYLYSSRLEGEAADGVEDVHFHPIEPINARITLSYVY